MQRVIATVGVKGGLGKTTVCYAVACEWHRRGRRVLIVDVDAKQRSALKQRERAADDADVPDVVPMDADGLLDIARAAEGYDVVLIDNPGTIGDVTAYSLGLADLVLMPCGQAAIEIEAMAETYTAVEKVRAKRPSLDAAILLCRKDTRTHAGRTLRFSFDDAPYDVLATELALSVDYDHAYKVGLGPTLWALDCDVSREVVRLVDELEMRLQMRRKPTRKVNRRAAVAL